MSTRKNRKREGGNLQRSEVMTLRFDPRTRYLMELASRIQRRTVSSFVDWAVTEALKGIQIGTKKVQIPRNSIELVTQAPQYRSEPTMLMAEAVRLWDPNEADRFAHLALAYPDLLNYDEAVLWKLIRECPAVWNAKQQLNLKMLRDHWETFKAVAAGTGDPETLPTPQSKDTDNG